ncbi:ABC transporter ATP-binding protein [Streptomyces sp. NPDC056527]|uniref:ABC transporter ATP-binding protein n=1 Tax=Streptomyces sp. NPDC056527 TaxID=3345853 RepID=UPI0036A186C9
MTMITQNPATDTQAPDVPVMRLRSDPYAEVSASMTVRAMAARLPRTVGTALRLGWRTDRRSVALWLAAQVLAAGAAAGALALTAAVLGPLLSDPGGAGGIGPWLAGARWPLAGLAACAAGRYALESLAQLAAARLAPQVTREADLQVLTAATAVELSAYEDPGFGDSLEAAGEGAEATRELMVSAQSLIGALGLLIGAGGYLAVLHPVLLPLLALAAVPRAVTAVAAARVEHEARHLTLSDSRLRSVWRSYATDRDSADEVRSSTMSAFLLNRYRAVSARLETEDLRAVRRIMRVRWAGDAAGALAAGCVWAALLALAARGVLSLPQAATAIVGVQACQRATSAWVRAGSELFRTALRLDDWQSFCRRAALLRCNRGTVQAAPTGPDTIAAAEAGFTYPGSDRPALHGIDLKLHRGEVVALVGENGSGKTTLANLLAGLYLPTTGVVSWDGHDLTACDPHSVWSRLGRVPQNFTRWPMTARDNITLGGHSEPGDTSVLDAAEAAGATDVIDRLPDGLDTLLARSWWGGHDLSGGQWQRLAIARAFHRDAPVLILDEPTSALDARAEHHVFERLKALANGRTTVFVTHRLVNTRLADRIIVLDRGQVVEEGDFTSLVTAGGLFADLYQLQQGTGNTAGA